MDCLSVTLNTMFTRDPYCCFFFLEDAIPYQRDTFRLRCLAIKCLRNILPLFPQHSVGYRVLNELKSPYNMELEDLGNEIKKVYMTLELIQQANEELYGTKETLLQQVVIALESIVSGDIEELKKFPYKMYDLVNSINNGAKIINNFELLDRTNKILNLFHKLLRDIIDANNI